MVNNVDVMRLLPMMLETVSIHIMDEAQPRFSKVRPVPLPLVDEVRKEFQLQQDRGSVKLNCNCKWASITFLLGEETGQLPEDVRGLQNDVNRSTASDAYLLPSKETIFTYVRGSKIDWIFERLNGR